MKYSTALMPDKLVQEVYSYWHDNTTFLSQQSHYYYPTDFKLALGIIIAISFLHKSASGNNIFLLKIKKLKNLEFNNCAFKQKFMVLEVAKWMSAPWSL